MELGDILRHSLENGLLAENKNKKVNYEDYFRKIFLEELREMPFRRFDHKEIEDTYKTIMNEFKGSKKVDPYFYILKKGNRYNYQITIVNAFKSNIDNNTSLAKSPDFKEIAHYADDKKATHYFWLDQSIYFAKKLLKSKNIIFYGAPGTGKTYLAKNIASYITSEEKTCSYLELDNECKSRIGFVQFHPSYDYVDFMEGLRPQPSKNGTISFQLGDGVFKSFVKNAIKNPDKKFVFIIDEINRGEISKIFGELFFAIDPSYRGERGSILTQYSYLHENEPLFYIPENLYLIGTMNNIDKSVDTFDFAMRRRFRFIELKPEDRIEILDSINNPTDRKLAHSVMKVLNDAIKNIDDLNEDYSIGPAYFLKLNEMSFNDLWYDSLLPLLKDYVHGLQNENEILEDLSNAYFLTLNS